MQIVRKHWTSILFIPYIPVQRCFVSWCFPDLAIPRFWCRYLYNFLFLPQFIHCLVLKLYIPEWTHQQLWTVSSLLFTRLQLLLKWLCNLCILFKKRRKMKFSVLPYRQIICAGNHNYLQSCINKHTINGGWKKIKTNTYQKYANLNFSKN